MALTTIPSELSSVSGISDSSTSTAITIDSSQNVTFAGNITTGSNTISGVLSSVTGSLGSAATATTQAASDNTTKIATTAYVTTALANMVDSAPSTLDTLNELAAALGDDANFSTTVTNSIATKLPLAGGTMTGDIVLGDNRAVKFGTGSDTSVYNDGSNFYIKNNTSNQDIIFQGNDDGSAGLQMLKLDASNAGAATFSGSVTTGGTVTIDPADGVADDAYALSVRNNEATDGRNYGLWVRAGSNSSDESFSVRNHDNSATYFKVRGDGNVGIGGSTITDSNLLNLQGSSASVNVGVVFNDTNTSKIFGIQNGGSALKFFDYTASAERMRIDSSGRVGVGGTPNANWRNDATDDVLMLGTEATLHSDAGVTTELWNNAYVDNSDTFKNISTRGASRYMQYSGAHKWFTAASASAGSTISTEINSSPKMVLDVSGNLGIGTSSPNGNGILTLNTPTDNSPQIVFSENDAGKWLIGHRHDGDYFRFYDLANSAERMRIDSSGNVGIGTSIAPVRKLDVKGSVNFSVNTSTHETFVFTTGAANDAKLLMQNASAATTVQLQANGASYLNGGNVGIGETAPLGRLHVKTADSGASVDVSADELVVEGSGNAGISILSGQSYTGNIYFGDSGVNWDGYIAYSQAQRRFTFGAAAGTRSLSIDSSGIYTNSYGNDATNTVYGANAYLNAASGGIRNVVLGSSAWYYGTTGDENVIIGTFAAGDNTGNHTSLTGAVYIGQEAGHLGAANFQTAIGYQAGRRNYGGSSVFVGYRSGGYSNSSSSGDNNVAVGYQALYAVTSGSDNVTVGRDAGSGLTTGYGNVFLGRDAGDSAVSAYRNICIGQNANPSQNNGEHQIILGHDISGPGDNHAMIGRGGQGYWKLSHTANTGWVFVSDERIKKNIQNDTLGLEFINKIRPVTYNHKKNEEIDADFLDSTVNWKRADADDTVLHRGLVAQEVKTAMNEVGNTNFDGWSQDDDGMQGVSKEAFITPLIKAVQELSAEVTALKAEVAALKGE